MRKAGIVGGLGPASTLDYYSGIIDGFRARAQDGSYPEIVIDSIDMTGMLSLVSAKDWDGLVALLAGAIRDLAGAGATFAAIASNTPHIVFDRVKAQSALPLISIIDATCAYAQSRQCRKVVVLGTRFTMGSGLYTEAFRRYGITAVVPSEDDQETIHHIIFPRLEDGIVVAEDKEKMLGIANRLIAQEQADGLVLGCTELPLMIHDGDLDTLILDSARIHIDAIVDALFKAP